MILTVYMIRRRTSYLILDIYDNYAEAKNISLRINGSVEICDKCIFVVIKYSLEIVCLGG